MQQDPLALYSSRGTLENMARYINLSDIRDNDISFSFSIFYRACPPYSNNNYNLTQVPDVQPDNDSISYHQSKTFKKKITSLLLRLNLSHILVFFNDSVIRRNINEMRKKSMLNQTIVITIRLFDRYVKETRKRIESVSY